MRRAAAWTCALGLLAGLAPAAAGAVAPVISSGVELVRYTIEASEPAPVQEWRPVTVINDTAGPTTLTVTGDRARFRYTFNGPAYAYLQPSGGAPETAQTVVLTDNPAPSGTRVMDLSSGTYQLHVRTDGTGWSVSVEEFTAAG